MRYASFAAAAVAALAFAAPAHAFCVNNLSSHHLSAWQTSGFKSAFKRFNVDLAPGERKCCNWQNSDCNHSGRADAEIEMRIAEQQTGFYNPPHVPRLTCIATIRADRWIEIYDQGDTFRCISY